MIFFLFLLHTASTLYFLNHALFLVKALIIQNSFFPPLFIYGCAGFSLRGGLFSSCSAWAAHCGGFSYCRAQALRCLGFSGCGAGLSSCSSRNRLSSSGAPAQLLHHMWDLPGSGVEPVSPASEGGFFTAEPPGKPYSLL